MLTYDAYISNKMLIAQGYFSIYSDDLGNQCAATFIMPQGMKPKLGWDDGIFVGTATRLINDVVATRLGIDSYDLIKMAFDINVNSKANLLLGSMTEPAATCAVAVNDYVCPGCHNDKCSKTEKSCWKCGFIFNK